MTTSRLVIALAIAIAPFTASAQDHALSDRVMQAVRAAVAPALPFPPSDALGALPADGKSDDPWMVRPIESGERTLQILANPLNEEHQRRAAKAMAEIEASIEAAQRRAEVQFDRAVAEAKRTGRSQDVDGVTLSDEGIAGAKIDAESHVTIDVSFSEVVPAGISISTIPSGVERGNDGIERFREAQSTVAVGMKRPADATSGISSLVIRMRGNETLIAELLRKSNWASLVELLK